MTMIFQSTPSVRRATINARSFCDDVAISIHALREEGDRFQALTGLRPGISIHALREEGDALLSYGRRAFTISIHALREEGDAPL